MCNSVRMSRVSVPSLAISGLVALLLAGCATGPGGHRRTFDHSFYRSADGGDRDIFPDPIGWRDRTIPNRLGALDAKLPKFFGVSEADEQVARQRRQLAPRVMPPAPPALAPQSSTVPAPIPAPQPAEGAAPPVSVPTPTPALPADAAKPIIYRSPARPVQPGIPTTRPVQEPTVELVPAETTVRGSVAPRRAPVASDAVQ